MKNNPLLKLGLAVGGLFLVLIVATSALHWRAPLNLVQSGGTGATTTSVVGGTLTLATTEGIERWYTNKALRFSFRLPDGFMAPEAAMDDPRTHGVVVHDGADHRLTVVALPIVEGTKLTAEDIVSNFPGVKVATIREGFIGSVIRGYSFRTDAEEWGGDSEAFWFAYNGYLYQISTFTKDVALLEFVLSSWRFAPPTPLPLR